MQKYNPDTNLWQAVAPLSTPRSNVCAVADDSYLYAVGDVDNTWAAVDIVERFDPRNNSWEKLPSTLVKRFLASGVIIKQELFIFGGMVSLTDIPCKMYDPVISVWRYISSPVGPRMFASAVSFKGKIFVSGDFHEDQMSLKVYAIDQNKWELVITLTKFCQLSRLRISRDVLAQCRVNGH